MPAGLRYKQSMDIFFPDDENIDNKWYIFAPAYMFLLSLFFFALTYPIQD